MKASIAELAIADWRLSIDGCRLTNVDRRIDD